MVTVIVHNTSSTTWRELTLYGREMVLSSLGQNQVIGQNGYPGDTHRCTVFLSETGAAKKQYLLNQCTNIAVIGLIRKSWTFRIILSDFWHFENSELSLRLHMGEKKKQAVEYVGVAWPGLEAVLCHINYIFDQ